jgi:DNA polymerase-1
MKRLVVIDGKSVFYRGYYAMGSLTLKDGTPVGGVYGFAAMALEVIKKLAPDYVAVAWDKKGTNIRRRVALYPQYKAGRTKAPDDFYTQIPILHELLDCFGWPLYECDDYEADDIIGTLSTQAEKAGLETCIISSDLDMLQVVDNNTHLYALKRGFSDIEKFDIAALEAKYGIKKEQFLDLKALRGDSSDNIPGVPGVGEKTGVALLQKYQDLNTIFVHLDEIKPVWAAKLQAGKDLAYISRQLAEIYTDAPIKFDLQAMDVHNLNTAKLKAELEKLEFRSLVRRLPEYMTNSAPAETEEQEAIPVKPQADIPADFTVVTNAQGQPALMNAKIFIAYDLKTFFEHDDRLDLLQNRELFDTRLAAFLLDSLRPTPDQNVPTAPEIYAEYLDLNTKLQTLPKMNKLAHEVDFPLQPILAQIEKRGVKLDVPLLGFMKVELHQKLKKLEAEIHNLAGEEFNIASPMQLSTILFNKLNLPATGIKKTKRGYSTDAKALGKLHDLHPIITPLEKYRELSKLQSTYVEALPKLVDDNSYLHTTFHQDITQTGRLSSSEPNLQNIPTRTELGQHLRSAFVASPGQVIVNADYSQFELRLAAALAGDTNLIEDFQDNTVDIHTKTAAEAFGKAIEDVTDKERRVAKVINFGVLYGMSPRGLSEATSMSFAEAKDFIERYFRIRQPIRDYINQTTKKAETDGYVETLFGRRRLTPDVKSPNFMVREGAKRAAANMPIQGTEADLMKMAMIKIEQQIPTARQFMQIHDSIMVECPPDQAENVGAQMKEIMENIYPSLGVHLKVDIKIGRNWGEL